jgi:hypothetical protein
MNRFPTWTALIIAFLFVFLVLHELEIRSLREDLRIGVNLSKALYEAYSAKDSSGGRSMVDYPLKDVPDPSDQVLGMVDPMGDWSVAKFSIEGILMALENDIGITIHPANMSEGDR